MPAAAVVAGVGLVSGAMQARAARKAAQSQANSQQAAAEQAAEMSRFRPVGVTTRFGSSNFTTDAEGNVTGAGYTLDPTLRAQQDQLLGISSNALQQYQNAFAQTQGLGQAGQSLIGLGQQYLASAPQEQAQKFLQEQQALLAPQRAEQLAGLRNNLFQRGREGLAIGGEGGMMATNPELAAYYNSIARQDRELAANATQAGMDYARFGAGLVGTGGGLLGSMYDVQNQAYSPYQTALGGAQTLEGLGQNALDLGVNIGARGTAASQVGAGMLQSGLNAAAASRAAAQANNPFASLLGGVSNALRGYTPTSTYTPPDYTGIPNYGYSTSWG